MRSTRPPGIGALVFVAGLSLVACVATPQSIVGSPVPSGPTPSSVPTAPLRPATSSVAVESSSPNDSPQPTNPPIPTPDPTEDSGTAGPGCGTGRAGLFAHNDEVPATLQFGGATIEFTNVSVSMRNGSYDTSDSIPGGIGLAPDETAVVVRPGDRIVLRAAGVTLGAVQARVIPWRSVEFEGDLASLLGDPVELSWRLRSDGSLLIAAPEAIGDYAVALSPGWTGTCIEGGGVAYSRIKVR